MKKIFLLIAGIFVLNLAVQFILYKNTNQMKNKS